jgi:hypothetical protein
MGTITYPRGSELLRQAVNKIIADPESWNQGQWHCGTQHCIGGHCQILGGRSADPQTTKAQAQEMLGLGDADANYLFYGQRTLGEIYKFAQGLLLRDRDGFDRDGRDRDGFDRDGRDRDGFDRDGRDRDGRDRDGKPLTPLEPNPVTQ